MSYTREQIEATVKAKGYKWFENGDYNVNIVGIRNSETGDRVTNKFDDKITITYKEDGEWQYDIEDGEGRLYHQRRNDEVWYYTYDSLAFDLAEDAVQLIQ